MIKSDDKNSQVSNLVDRCNEETLISLLSNLFATLFASILKTSIIVPSSKFVTRLKDIIVKQLTEMIQSFALFVYTI